MKKYVDIAPVVDWLDDNIRNASISEEEKNAYRNVASILILDMQGANVREDITATIEAREIGTLVNRLQTTFYYCSHCKTIVRPEDNYCKVCGARFIKGLDPNEVPVGLPLEYK